MNILSFTPESVPILPPNAVTTFFKYVLMDVTYASYPTNNNLALIPDKNP